MKPCPDCSAALKEGASKCACGWRAQPAPGATKDAAPVDPDHKWRCQHETLGQRCNEPGPYKRGDRWLCDLHAGKRSIVDTIASEAGRAGIARCKAVLAKASANRPKRVGDAVPIGEIAVQGVRDIEHAMSQEEADAWGPGRE